MHCKHESIKLINPIEIQISTIAQRSVRYFNDPLRVIFRNARINFIIRMKDRLINQSINVTKFKKNHIQKFETCYLINYFKVHYDVTEHEPQWVVVRNMYALHYDTCVDVFILIRLPGKS